MSGQSFDVVIIGAGPAGTSAAIALRDSALSVAIVDRARFPRDKTCGDALSVDVVNQLSKLSPTLMDAFRELSPKAPSGGVRIIAPSHEFIDIPFQSGSGQRQGYVCRRIDFDMLMLAEARRDDRLTVKEGCEVQDVRLSDDSVTLQTTHGTLTAKLIIAADGAQSVVKRKMTTSKINPRFHSAGIRTYHAQINGFHTDNFIELYFLREILPGYLWIFPLPDGYANVGIGMLTSAVSSRKVNLNKVFRQLLATHPLLAERFRNATVLEQPQGYGLPLGGAHGDLSGNRYLLTGDAASLIDPFSGEGIGNAIRSGRFAAAQAIESFRKNNFSREALRQYDLKMNSMLKSEFEVSRGMLRLCQFPAVFNTIVRKANRNAQLHQTLIDALAFPDKKGWLISPAFYFNLLFRS
jgi:geranylgeranyl reductase family protein